MNGTPDQAVSSGITFSLPPQTASPWMIRKVAHARPAPYRGWNLTVSFATFGGICGGGFLPAVAERGTVEDDKAHCAPVIRELRLGGVTVPTQEEFEKGYTRGGKSGEELFGRSTHDSWGADQKPAHCKNPRS